MPCYRSYRCGLGLILALQKLDNPAEMAAGIAGAFTATVTGIAGAYIFMGPWGNKLKAKSHDFIKEKHVILQRVFWEFHTATILVHLR